MELKDFVILILLGLGLWLFFKPEAMPHITVQEPAYSQPAVVYATPAPPTIPLVEATATAPHYVEAVPVPTQRIDFEATTDAFMLTLETAVEPTAMPLQNMAAPLGGSTPTAISPYAPPEGGYTVQFLQDCAAALQGNRRGSPRCPANAAEMLAGGGR